MASLGAAEYSYTLRESQQDSGHGCYSQSQELHPIATATGSIVGVFEAQGKSFLPFLRFQSNTFGSLASTNNEAKYCPH